MKRKIAAIVAADIAEYSTLVADDEEETPRRLAPYRAVIDDFTAKSSGRIFNTAGDAVLAEAVEAVRCAIDIQESLRTRNVAYPRSRQMNFRIGVTIGDVVERDGDLLDDGVNIAARLEGLAQPGGICVSHAVYEQVSIKISGTSLRRCTRMWCEYGRSTRRVAGAARQPRVLAGCGQPR
jgi:class 3 adenylate cyclase